MYVPYVTWHWCRLQTICWQRFWRSSFEACSSWPVQWAPIQDQALISIGYTQSLKHCLATPGSFTSGAQFPFSVKAIDIWMLNVFFYCLCSHTINENIVLFGHRCCYTTNCFVCWHKKAEESQSPWSTFSQPFFFKVSISSIQDRTRGNWIAVWEYLFGAIFKRWLKRPLWHTDRQRVVWVVVRSNANLIQNWPESFPCVFKQTKKKLWPYVYLSIVFKIGHVGKCHWICHIQ